MTGGHAEGAVGSDEVIVAEPESKVSLEILCLEESPVGRPDQPPDARAAVGVVDPGSGGTGMLRFGGCGSRSSRAGRSSEYARGFQGLATLPGLAVAASNAGKRSLRKPQGRSWHR